MTLVRFLILGVGLSVLGLPEVGEAITIHPHPIVTAHRLELTREYCRVHYGLDSSTLKDPKIIVVHTTECATLDAAEKTFAPDVLESDRKYLRHFGEVNVGVHFLVDRNGDIYSLLPLTVIGRHTIGLNYTAIGIENIGFADKLTPQQLESNADLIAMLTTEFPSVHYLIGHYEYTDRALPHYALYTEKVPEYHPTEKSDPGIHFMATLRNKLTTLNLHLEN